MASSISNEFECPNCGTDIHPNARACKKCGFSATAPPAKWQQPEHLDGIDLPPDPDNDPTFDYDDYVAREFSEEGDQPIIIDGRKLIWWLTAVVLLLVLAYVVTHSW